MAIRGLALTITLSNVIKNYRKAVHCGKYYSYSYAGET